MPSATTDPTTFNLWKQNDQLVMSLILFSLTGEALETTFNHKSKVHELQIKDELHLMKHGSPSVFEYSQVFKAHCDQLSVMACLVEYTNKIYWYLHGLGHEFTTFSANQLCLSLVPSFKDVVPKIESFDLFSKSIDHSTSDVSVYMANSSSASFNQNVNPNNYQQNYK